MNETLQMSQDILNEKINKIIPENIKKGVTVFDVTGTLEEGVISEQEFNTAVNTINDILGV